IWSFSVEVLFCTSLVGWALAVSVLAVSSAIVASLGKAAVSKIKNKCLVFIGESKSNVQPVSTSHILAKMRSALQVSPPIFYQRISSGRGPQFGSLASPRNVSLTVSPDLPCSTDWLNRKIDPNGLHRRCQVRSA